MRAVVFPVLCVCAILVVPVSAAAQKSRTCAPSAIRAAAAKQVAPNLVGCRYDEVAVPLVRYFSIFPVLTKTPGSAATSTILEQTPAAGEPLAAGGQLALNVSVGPSQKPEAPKPGTPKPEETAAAPVETPVAEAVPPQQSAPDPVPVLAVSDAPAEILTVAPEAPARSPGVSWPSVKWPALAYLFRPALLGVWLGLLVFGIGIVMTFRGRRKRPEKGYDRVPKVTARLEYGPGRLSAHGPLVVSRESGQ
jgi:hypothetical protein